MKTATGLLVLSLTLACSSAPAKVLSIDHPKFGVDALTRDTDQGLDFLDLTLSVDRSFNDVSVQFGVGGDFEGFRYATEAEVVALINNFGFSPGAIVGPIGPIRGDTSNDQLSGLVDLLGITQTTMDFRASAGITGDPHTGARGFQRVVAAIDVFDPGMDDSTTQGITPLTTGSRALGSFLVVPAVPEPGSFTLCATISGMGMILRRRRKRFRAKR